MRTVVLTFPAPSPPKAVGRSAGCPGQGPGARPTRPQEARGTPFAMHASLEPDALLAAYARGWFPMDEPGASGPVGLYEADPRGVMPIEGFRVPPSVGRRLRRAAYEIRLDAAFPQVAAGCAVRPGEPTWLTPRLVAAYERLHGIGLAHSVEAWRDGRLCGGLFGVALGGLFTSESMFHRAPDAGNAALVATARMLRAAGYALWDIQMTSPHTARFGALDIAPRAYRRRLREALDVVPGPLNPPTGG
jgi:leucyl/phenylalanyl-tRNA---protein transferase